jgi:hypothetical protein
MVCSGGGIEPTINALAGLTREKTSGCAVIQAYSREASLIGWEGRVAELSATEADLAHNLTSPNASKYK